MNNARSRGASANSSKRTTPSIGFSGQNRASSGGHTRIGLQGRPSSNSRDATAANSKPSSKLNAKTINPFDEKAPKSVFETAYANGAVPCRLQHGSVKHKLQWTTPPENLNYDPILVTLAEGLRETRHPYTFVACEGFKEMLMIEEAEERTVPLLPKLIPPIRFALASTNVEVFYKALQALTQLSDVTGPALNPHLKFVLPQVSKRILDRNHKDKVISALQRLEYNGGRECLAVIKARIPTYNSIG
eukprot:Seg2721.2 transcript_id=Seg2721.2/GoldUCD/mRNA.D3Y31 product="PACRG-like protein" protein_id=Seg2721.2/GoldUCD/D3Y31